MTDHRRPCRRRSGASAAGPGVDVAAGDRVEHQEAGGGDRDQQQDQRPVQREELARRPERSATWTSIQAHARSSSPRPARSRAAAAAHHRLGRLALVGRIGLERRQAAVERAAAGCRARSGPRPSSRRRHARRSGRRRSAACRRARSTTKSAWSRRSQGSCSFLVTPAARSAAVMMRTWLVPVLPAISIAGSTMRER